MRKMLPLLFIILFLFSCSQPGTVKEKAKQSSQEFAWPEELGPYKQWEGEYAVKLQGFDRVQTIKVQGLEKGIIIAGERLTVSMSNRTNQPRNEGMVLFPVVDYDPKKRIGKIHISGYELNLGLFKTVDFEFREKNGKKELVLRTDDGNSVVYTHTPATVNDLQTQFPNWEEVNYLSRFYGNYKANLNFGMVTNFRDYKVEIDIGQENYGSKNENGHFAIVTTLFGPDGMPYANTYTQELCESQKAKSYQLNREHNTILVKDMLVFAHGHEGEPMPNHADVILHFVPSGDGSFNIVAKYKAMAHIGEMVDYQLDFVPQKD